MQQVQFKSGVDASGVHPHLWFHLGIIGLQHFLVTNHIMMVTSMRRPWKGGRPSKHRPLVYKAITPPRQPITAADFRRWYLDDLLIPVTAEDFCLWIQQTMGDQIGVVLEPEWLSKTEIKRRGGVEKIAPHIHIQSKYTAMFKRLSIL